ncbi:MAG: glycosyltransferase family 2 protein [Akkermansia sp.]
MSTGFPLVSIVMPIYRVEPYVAESIRSVLAQDYPALELILVDDCGGDRSVEIACELLEASSVPWKLLRHDQNRGQSAARNTGEAQAEGDYLFFVDSDDYLAPDCLSLLVREAERTGAEMVFGNYMNEQEGVLSPGFYTRAADAVPETEPLRAHVGFRLPSVVWNRLLRLKWYRATGVRFIEGILHEDEPWSLALAFRSRHIAFVNKITYFYRQNPASSMHDPAHYMRRAQACVLLLQFSRQQIDRYRSALPQEYVLWHHRNMMGTLRNYCVRWRLPNQQHYCREVLRYAWLPSWRALALIPLREGKALYVLSFFLPAYVACRVNFRLIALIDFIKLIKAVACERSRSRVDEKGECVQTRE